MQKLLNALRLGTKTTLPIILIAILFSAGCSSMRFPGVYRIDIGQGNLLTKEMIEKLRLGMTPRQVEYVMGSPMIWDTFHPDRWDYLYSLETGKGLEVTNQLTLYFENERLARIDTSRYKDPDQLRDDLLEQMGMPVPQAPPADKPNEEPAGSAPEASDSQQGSAATTSS